MDLNRTDPFHVESLLRDISERIERAGCILRDAHSAAHRKMVSIGNKKRIQKAYDGKG